MPVRNGFTLIELMVVIAIVAILSSIGYPSFRELILNNRLTAQTNALLGTLQYARSEAVTQKRRVIVCPSRDQATCEDDPADWQRAIIVLLDNGTVARVLPASADLTILDDATDSIVFEIDGTSLANGELRICDDRGDANSRTLLVNGVGQARSRAFQNGDLACE
ncbi:GspH/FimT family pseudopilin [Pseudomonas sp. D(2018)]|uniref:GspH/FimT family pseudopilin n=1 Tax=Pseudomonas sp. D(2018) TaxID=2502238 RepID=UPI0010F44322|nr:GspH/FimT family pseudopilin [Pseudomonas sp. D(2018)]